MALIYKSKKARNTLNVHKVPGNINYTIVKYTTASFCATRHKTTCSTENQFLEGKRTVRTINTLKKNLKIAEMSDLLGQTKLFWGK